MDRLEGAKASSAALLLELLYLHRLNPTRRVYLDRLLAGAYRECELGEDRAVLAGVDELIITTFANVAGKDVTSVYENHDEEVGRFLYSEAVRELGALQGNLEGHSSEYMNYIASQAGPEGFAKELLIPVTVIGVASVQVDPGRVANLLSDLEEKSRELNERRRQIEGLERTIEELSKQMGELQERVGAMERELEGLRPERLKADASLVKEIREIRHTRDHFIPTQTSDLKTRIDNLASASYDRVRAEIEERFIKPFNEFINHRRIEQLRQRARGLVDECRRLMERGELSKDDMANLGKSVISLEEVSSTLRHLLDRLEELKKKLSDYAERTKPSLSDKVFGRSKAIVHGMLKKILERFERLIEDLSQEKSRLEKELEEIKKFYEAKLKERG